jgi:hypothetical protein
MTREITLSQAVREAISEEMRRDWKKAFPPV